MSITKIGPAGVNLIKGFEGFVGHPYQDSVKVWTIGYGHTHGVGPHTKSINALQGRRLLASDLNREYAPIVARAARRYGVKLNQHQFDALVSFVFNLGGGYLETGHSPGDAMKNHNMKALADSLLQFDHAGGERLLGLTRRRQAERHLFLKPVKAPARLVSRIVNRSWNVA